MQNGNSENKDRKPISLSELSFADIAKMRREREKSEEERAATQLESIPKRPPVKDEKPQEAVVEGIVIELRDDVDIQTDYYKTPNDLHNIAPLQDPKEHCAYTYLYRLSYGWKRNFCRTGYGDIMKNTSLSSRSSVIRAIEGLIEKKHIIRIEENSLKRAGSLYRVLTPQEILSGVFKTSIVKMSIVKLNISKLTISKLNIVKMKTDYIQNEYSQIKHSYKNGATSKPTTVSNMNIVKSIPNKNSLKDNKTTTEDKSLESEIDPEVSKDVLVVVFSSNFFKNLPESTISKLCSQYGTKKVIEKVRGLEEQYSGRRMENAGGLLTDALKKDYRPPQNVVRKHRAEELAKKREKEELVKQELLKQEENIRERISAEKAKLGPKQQEKLRRRALHEIGNMEGIKEEFVTKILIEAKENEILRTEMESEDLE